MRSPGWLAFAGSALAFACLSYFLYWYTRPETPGPVAEAIVIHCADALRAPLEAIRAQYEKETDQKIEIRVGASQSLLAQMELSRQGDLYLPADDSFLEMARKRDLVRETIPLATMDAVVVVNPKAPPLSTWNDFISPERDIILANPDAAAIGKLTRAALQKSGRWAEIERRKPVFQGKISEVGSAVLLNPKGTGIVFEPVAAQFPKLTVVTLPELKDIRANVAIAVTSFSKHPTAALGFARFVAARDRGLKELAQLHYRVNDIADNFTPQPELKLFGGTMLRPAIEDLIHDFEKREGVVVHTNWNGCGILVGEMKTKKIPDIYFACEPRFLEKVQDLFHEPDVVSSNRLVITVRKGNPHHVHTLKDLAQDGIKVGVGNENQCALGDLTKTTFVRTGLYGRVRRNIAKEAPSGDLLISDFRGGALDVIVCYESNVKPYLDELEYFPVDIGASNKDCTNPMQPVAIGKACAHPQLARRLLDALQTPEARARFEKLGFGWVKQ